MKRKNTHSDSDENEELGSDSTSVSEAGASGVGIVTSPTFSSLFSVTPSLSASSARTSILSLHEEKKACRRHRRRLARIVTEQWKYAARAKLLALKFHRVAADHAVRTTFLEWKRIVDQKSATVAKVDNVLFALARCRRILRTWIRFSYRSRRFRLGLIYFSEIYSARRSSSVLKAWRDYVELRIIHQKQKLTADHYYMVSCLSRCFSDWRLVRQVQQKKNFFYNVANAKWIFSRQRLVLRAWKFYLTLKVKSAMQNDMVDDLWRHRTLFKCLKKWHSKREVLSDSDYDSSVDALVEKAEMDMAVLVCDNHFKKTKQKDVVSQWLMITRSHLAQKLAVQNFYHQTLLKNSIRCWMEYSSWSKLKLQQQTTLLKSVESSRLRRCIRCWMEYSSRRGFQKQQEKMALEEWVSRRIRSCWFIWLEHSVLRRSNREKLSIMSNRRRARLLGSCFRVWCGYNAESARKRSLESRAAGWRTGMLTGRVLSDWKRVLLRRRLTNAWKKWQGFHQRRAVKRSRIRGADDFWREQRARSVLHAWQSFRHEKTPDQQQSGEIYIKLLQKLAFLGWFQLQRVKVSTTNSSQDHPVKKCSSADSVKITRARPAARRPPFAFVHPSQSQSSDSSSLSAHSQVAKEILPLVFKEDPADCRKLPVNNTELLSRATNCSRACEDWLLEQEPDISHVIADEVAWMEQLVTSFDDLRAELIERRAELSLLMEKNTPGSREKAQFLTQKIALLQQRRAIMLPTVQAVASIMPGLRLRARKASKASGASKPPGFS